MPVLDAAFALKNGGGTALDLKGRGVSRVDPSIASGCPSLGKLDLGDNVVSDRGSIAAIAECVQLKWLSLANCGLGGAGLAPRNTCGSEMQNQIAMTANPFGRLAPPRAA